MKKTHYDMIYLAACGVNGIQPAADRVQGMDLEKLYRISHIHSIDALVGMVLEKTGIRLPKVWSEKIAKAVRKVILFDMERTKLFSFMEEKGIWYLPLKGVILKDYYPAVGMRQMSDNDILFDADFSAEVQAYMESQGYKAEEVGMGNHDVYRKEPVYNFEFHNALYGWPSEKSLIKYYSNIKERLILNDDSSYGYHFTDEDCYVYITSHAYKHYSGGGTGIRTLLDFYVYMKAKPELDFAYIEKECKVLGIADFEKRSRILCKKVFDAVSLREWDTLESQLSQEEVEMLAVYLSSGVYGTKERKIQNKVQKLKEDKKLFPKLRYLWKQIGRAHV